MRRERKGKEEERGAERKKMARKIPSDFLELTSYMATFVSGSGKQPGVFTMTPLFLLG